MFKSVVLAITVAFISLNIHAEEEKLPPLDPAYMGVHGMVLMSKSSTVFASHLPLYNKPHNVQLIYKLEVKDFNLVQVVRDNDLVTIKPEAFNLQRLMRGEKMTINAELYIGHFERDGMKVYDNVSLVFDKQLYMRELTDIAPSSNEQEYDVVSYNSKADRLYIHRLQKAPSFDHIIHIDRTAGCLNKFKTSSAVPKRNELQFKFMNCGTMKPMYFETQDFNQ
ncbi:hypothetical protein [Thalassotalea atypica]|uniref:hypothetical protein n=1 Tax=Thalassotalea atypica TaxID=2054316 RepID=UPI002572EAA5|nr:hypothetical protein [Thalassotalea atypica]